MARKQDLRIRSHERHAAPRHGGKKTGEKPQQAIPAQTSVPVQELPQDDGQPPLREVKKRRRGRSFIWVVASRLVLVGLLVAGGFFIWQNWEKLAPDSLLIWIDGTFGGGDGNGYPVTITGSTVLHMEDMEGSLALLSDTSFTMLNSHGKETVRRPHTYTNPLMEVAGKYALIAETGGKRLSLETRSQTVWKKTLDYTIVSAAVSENGTVAVVTSADQSYSCEIIAFKSNGQQLYRRSRGRQAVDVAVSPDGRSAAVVSLAADNGDICSYLEVFRFDSDSQEPVFSEQETGLMLCAVEYLSDGTLTALGDGALWIADTQAGGVTRCSYNGRQLLGYAVSGNTAAVVTRAYGSTDGGEVSVYGRDGTRIYNQTFTGAFRNVAPWDDGYLLLTGESLLPLGYEAAGTVVSLPGDGRLVSGQGNKAVVLGLTALTQYSLEQ